MKNLNFLTDLRNSDQVITRLRPGNNQVKTTLRFVAILTLIFTFGVGNAWGAATTGTITFGNGSGDLTINSASVYGNDSQSNRWDVTVAGSSVYFAQNTDYSQVGSNSNPATSITFEMTLGSSQTISAFSLSLTGAATATRGRVNLKVGSTVIGTDTVSGNGTVSITNNTWTSGTKLTVEIINITGGLKLKTISYTYGETMQTVSWSVNGGAASGGTTSVPNGAKVLTLPTEPTSSDCDESKVFVGWSNAEIDGSTDTRPSVLFKTQANAPAVTGTTTYYAVFATSTAGLGPWEKISGTPIPEGDYLIVQAHSTNWYMMNNTVSTKKLGGTLVEVTNDTISRNATVYKWHIKETATSNVYTIKNGDNYLVGTGTKSEADLVGSPSDDKELFTITYNSTRKEYTLVSNYNTSASVNATLRYGGSYYACYGASNPEPFIFKRGAALSAFATTCCTNKIAAPSVSVTKTAYTVSLSWTMASGVSKYEVQWNGGDWEEVTSSYSKSSLTPNTEYTWTVRAKTWSGDECGATETISSTTTNQVYTVTYAAGAGGSGTITDSNSPYEAGDEVTVKTSDGFSKCGSHFNGWTYSPAQSVTDGKFTMPSSNVTITATWAANDNDVYYDWMSSVETSTNKSGSYSTPAAISDKVEAVGCEGQHKHFIGWVEEKDINADGSLKSGATIYNAGQSGMCAEGKHYYAVWADEE